MASKEWRVVNWYEKLNIILAVILSDTMCAVVAYNDCGLLWGIEYAGYSAPANTAFLYAIPYEIGIVACIVFSIVFHKKPV